MNVIRNKNGSNFVNTDDVWPGVSNKMSKPQFKELLKELENDGSIYQAGNENTYCITD